MPKQEESENLVWRYRGDEAGGGGFGLSQRRSWTTEVMRSSERGDWREPRRRGGGISRGRELWPKIELINMQKRVRGGSREEMEDDFWTVSVEAVAFRMYLNS
ncbi:hypothetical protein L596_028065 [Steinernema carpocapsae]|uniref:Uncharacterized protein n=1 Tax=Steinernema carpocapsae TaxID=34508 RepID=A0A4U5LXG3_STECR|nr:hypothetical protein L596_028065 [Steinernema carpocapsae]